MATDSFRDYVLEQLAALDGVNRRRMFGGHSLYLGERFFGIIHGGGLYFRTNPATLADYLRRQRPVFKPSARQVLKNYREVPVEILEDAASLALWTARACQ